ncbi:MAG: VOC family protein [Alphaproteobacteria bacterium]|jgi:catechol 2,3-dioxygenase|nr:VOC family protein [Alphaproteobacteria bacterium]
MKIQSLGHVVLKVANQARAEEFYNGFLGLPIAARFERLNMTFFSLGDHHDFAVMAVGDDAAGADDKAVGLQHVAFKIGDDPEVLIEAKAKFDAAGIEVRAVDHEVTQSLYFFDPDGNQLEVYVDVSDEWKRDPQAVAQGRPLDI